MNEILLPLASALATAIGGTLVAGLLARVRAGRFSRTLDQTNKVLDLVERYSGGYESLAKIPDAKRAAAERLMQDALNAVQEDFNAERAVLGQFGETTSSVRNALLLSTPRRSIMWLPFLVFHTLLLFMIYVVFVRALQGQWRIEDTMALLITAACAAVVRLGVRLAPV